MNPVGRILMSLGTGASVVNTSSLSVLVAAVSRCPVVVGTALSSLGNVEALATAVLGVVEEVRVTKVVYAAALPRSMSSLITIRISCTGGLVGPGCSTMNKRTPSAIEANQRVMKRNTTARIQGIRIAFRGRR